MWKDDDVLIDFVFSMQMLFEGVLATVDNDGKPPQITAELGFTREQVEHIQRILRARDNCERLGVQPGASKYVLTKAQVLKTGASTELRNVKSTFWFKDICCVCGFIRDQPTHFDFLEVETR